MECIIMKKFDHEKREAVSEGDGEKSIELLFHCVYFAAVVVFILWHRIKIFVFVKWQNRVDG